MKDEGSGHGVVIGPGRLQTMSQILHRLVALTIPDHKARYGAADGSRHPKHCFHSL